jgi:hypothetical protein
MSGDGSPDPLAIERAYDVGLKAAHGDAQQVGLIAAQAVTAPAPAFSSDAMRRGGDAAFRLQEPAAASGVRPEYLNSGRWIADPQ